MAWRLGKTIRFWQWFEANRDRLEAMEARVAANGRLDQAAATLTEELHSALGKVDTRLSAFVGQCSRDGMFELIVTADGNAAAFPAVFELFRRAPDVPGWRMVPLKPRMPIDGTIATGDVEIEVAKLHYFVNRSGDLPAVLLLAETDIDDESWDTWQYLAELLLVSMLGEYEFATRVGDFGIVSRAKFEAAWGHGGLPVAELPAEFPSSRPH
jgi:hypothetical protein